MIVPKDTTLVVQLQANYDELIGIKNYMWLLIVYINSVFAMQ